MATDTEIVRRVNDLLHDYRAGRLNEYETVRDVSRAVILRDVSR